MSLLRHPFIKKHAPQIIKFALAGGLGAMIDLGSLTLLVEYVGVEEHLAVIPSTLCAVCVVFLLNKHVTFKDKKGNYGPQILKFAFVYGVAILSNILISSGLILIGVHYFLSKVIAIAVGAIWNYAMSHGFVFKKGDPITEEAVIV